MVGPMKLAIVGGGPSSFYVASRLLSLLPHGSTHSSYLKIHIYDRLWAPHGLVRYGVAPDHPEVKNCVHKFDQAALDARLRFFGNVHIGTESSTVIPHALHLPLSSLQQNYTHLLFSSGCGVPILHPALPPSPHVLPALSLVHWYTQHPSQPTPPPLDKVTHVTLIGQGNVSLDVARMLLTDPSVLQQYDVPEPVLAVLRRSTVQHVSIVGRRGPLEAAFTTKELREMMNLGHASMVPLDPAVLAQAAAPGTALSRQQSRTLQLLQKGSVNKPGSTAKTWSLDFFRSPTGLAASTSTPTPSSQLTLALAHTALDADARAVPTGATSAQPTDLVITSLGHRADPAAPFYDARTGHLRTRAGRITDGAGRAVRGVYASGWAAMGARGVLASTMMDAYGVADTMLSDHFIETPEAAAPKPPLEYAEEDMMAREVDLESVPEEVERGVREGRVVQYEQWKAVDAEEVKRGEARHKERERMGWEEAHAFLTSAKAQ